MAHNQYYVDVTAITPGETRWVTRDLYLDVSIHQDGRPMVLDTDKYLAAVQEGLLDAQEAAQALNTLHRLVNGLLATGDLEAWLAQEGIHLPWRGDVRTEAKVGHLQ